MFPVGANALNRGQPIARFIKMLTIGILLCAGSSCSTNSDTVKRYPIEGEVTFAGKPVPFGTITLEPDAKKGNKGPTSIGTIENSRFSIPTARGIVGGPYRILVTGYGEPPTASEADVSYGTPLFSEYEIFRDLPTETSSQRFEIPKAEK